MEAKAIVRHTRISASKLRRYVDLIRGQRYPAAVGILTFMPSPNAAVVKKTLESAGANAEDSKNLAKDSLFVSGAWVDEGPTMKRWRAGSMGRARRIRKRSAHVTIVLSDQKPKKKK